MQPVMQAETNMPGAIAVADVGQPPQSQHCPLLGSLPLELWTNVLAHVDDFTLWVQCRQVCKTFRSEAVRVFQRDRLPGLSIRFRFENHSNGGEYRFGDGETAGIASVSPGTTQATFNLQTTRYSTRDDIPPPDSIWTDDFGKKTMIIPLVLSDMDRTTFDYDACKWIYLGDHCNNVPIPDAVIDYQKRVLTFDYSRLMDCYFKEDAYAWAQGIKDTVTKYSEMAEQSLVSKFGNRDTIMRVDKEKWVVQFSEEHDTIYEEAYLRRLKDSFRQAGALSELATFERSQLLESTDTLSYLSGAINTKTHVEDVRQIRNSRIVEDFIRRKSIAVVGKNLSVTQIVGS